MGLIIYRASNGAAYPGILSRLLIDAIIFIFSYSFTERPFGDIFLTENRLTYVSIFLCIVCIHEFIYFSHLWAVWKIYTNHNLWQYVIFQFGITVGIFTNLIHRAIFHFGLDYLNADPLFVHETLMILNILYFCSYLNYARKYLQYIIVERNGESKLLRVVDIASFSFTSTYIYISDKEFKMHGVFSSESPMEFIKKLDPRYFKLIEENAIINRKFFKKNVEGIKAIYSNSEQDTGANKE